MAVTPFYYNAVPEKPMLHAKITSLCFIKRELLPTEVLHCGNGNFLPFWLLCPWSWPNDLHIRFQPVDRGDNSHVQIWTSTSYVNAFESYRLTDIQTDDNFRKPWRRKTYRHTDRHTDRHTRPKLYTTRKRAIAKALHLIGRTTSRQSFWHIMRIFWIFVFLFENIVFSDVLWSSAWQPPRGATPTSQRAYALNK